MWYWSSNVVPFYFIIYTFASLTDHSKASNDMDIDSITVGFSNIASPSKQNPTVFANELTVPDESLWLVYFDSFLCV